MDEQEIDGHILSLSISENPRADSSVQVFTHLKNVVILWLLLYEIVCEHQKAFKLAKRKGVLYSMTLWGVGRGGTEGSLDLISST